MELPEGNWREGWAEKVRDLTWYGGYGHFSSRGQIVVWNIGQP